MNARSERRKGVSGLHDWRLGIGKGGQIYSLRGSFGESVPPQRIVSPWNDEVWQFVITSEKLSVPAAS